MIWPELTEEGRARVIEVARGWIGTPYRLCRIDKGTGVDCSGFVAAVYYKALNVRVPKDCDSLFVKAPIRHLYQHKPGDLIFFRKAMSRNRVRLARHVAILSGCGQCIHASYKRRRVCEESLLEVTGDYGLEVIQEKKLAAMMLWLIRYYIRTENPWS